MSRKEKRKQIRDYMRWYRVNCREAYLKAQRKYRKSEKFKQIRGAKWLRWYHKTPLSRVSHNIRCRIRLAIQRQSGSKMLGTEQLLGSTVRQTRAWIESLFQPGMSWSNYGEWQIDHKRPCASFDLTKPSQQKKCFHYTNLQPLWKEDNQRKGVSRGS